ncbi:MAG: GIY-YIG nuclease family protein [Patescibacteria group bacterium]|nr:GIY-YIG nuclease family protein [Patescibacteria group bacterium]
MFKVNTGSVPKNPGVYWFLTKHKVIYVGKAKNLKNRLNSYCQLARIDTKTKLMLELADKVKFKVLDSEIEAILTEAELISLYRPRFNLILRDDKSPVYVLITKELYPRVLTVRGQGSFGPFTSARTLRLIIERLRHIFPYCEYPSSGRPCFYFHLGLCPGACTKIISPSSYQKNISNIKLFFQNKKKRLVSSLKKDMLQLAKKQDYEQAKIIKNQLDSLDNFWQAQLMSLELPRLSQTHVNLELKQLFKFPVKRIETYDISNLSGTNPTGAMVVAVNGRIDKRAYRLFNIRGLTTSNDPAMMAEMIARRLNHQEWPSPDLIVVDGSVTQIKAVKKVLSQPIPVVGLAKNPDRLVFYDKVKSVQPLNPSSGAARLLIQLRDEAHRFGRKQHLRLRSKSLFL